MCLFRIRCCGIEIIKVIVCYCCSQSQPTVSPSHEPNGRPGNALFVRRFQILVRGGASHPCYQHSAYLWNQILLNPLQLGLFSTVFCHHHLLVEFMGKVPILVVVQ